MDTRQNFSELIIGNCVLYPYVLLYQIGLREMTTTLYQRAQVVNFKRFKARVDVVRRGLCHCILIIETFK